jgi:hypothetical protein
MPPWRSPVDPPGDAVIRELKLVGFVILLTAIFLGAHLAGSHLGPVTTTHSQVSYPGGAPPGTGGMNMGGSGGYGGLQVPLTVRLREGHR